MADQVSIAKDASIAFLSTSALLLTLMLGFISPVVPLAARVWVQFATSGLYMASLSAVITLFFLIDPFNRTRRKNGSLLRWEARFILIQFLSLILGLIFIAEAIVVSLGS